MSVNSALAVNQALPPPPSDLFSLQQELQDNNLELRAMEQKVAALKAEAPAAGALPDPVIGFGLANVPVDTFKLDQEAMTQKQIFVDQKFPWAGTLSLQEQHTLLQAKKGWFELQAKKLSLTSRLDASFYDLLFAEQSLMINRQLQGLVTQVLRVAESRYETGQGGQQDILAAQVKLSEFMDERISLQSRERSLRATIAALLNRTGPVDEVFVPAEVALPEKVDGAAILTTALQNSPELQAKGVAVKLAENEIALAEKAYLPGFDVRLGYGQRDDNPLTGEDRADFLSASVALSVPLWRESKQGAKLAAAKKRKLAAENDVESLQLQLHHDIDRLVNDLAGIRESYQLFSETLSVQTRNQEDASLAAYSTGKIEFNTMLGARLQVLRTELARYRFVMEYCKKLADLHQLAGIGPSQEEVQ